MASAADVRHLDPQNLRGAMLTEASSPPLHLFNNSAASWPSTCSTDQCLTTCSSKTDGLFKPAMQEALTSDYMQHELVNNVAAVTAGNLLEHLNIGLKYFGSSIQDLAINSPVCEGLTSSR